MTKYLIVPGKNVQTACEGCGNVVDLSDCAAHKIREGLGTFAVVSRKRSTTSNRATSVSFIGAERFDRHVYQRTRRVELACSECRAKF